MHLSGTLNVVHNVSVYGNGCGGIDVGGGDLVSGRGEASCHNCVWSKHFSMPLFSGVSGERHTKHNPISASHNGNDAVWLLIWGTCTPYVWSTRFSCQSTSWRLHWSRAFDMCYILVNKIKWGNGICFKTVSGVLPLCSTQRWWAIWRFFTSWSTASTISWSDLTTDLRLSADIYWLKIALVLRCSWREVQSLSVVLFHCFAQQSLTRGNNSVDECVVRNWARWKRTYQAGVGFFGVGNYYSNNKIYDAPHTAMIGECEC